MVVETEPSSLFFAGSAATPQIASGINFCSLNFCDTPLVPASGPRILSPRLGRAEALFILSRFPVWQSGILNLLSYTERAFPRRDTPLPRTFPSCGSDSVQRKEATHHTLLCPSFSRVNSVLYSIFLNACFFAVERACRTTPFSALHSGGAF